MGHGRMRTVRSGAGVLRSGHRFTNRMLDRSQPKLDLRRPPDGSSAFPKRRTFREWTLVMKKRNGCMEGVDGASAFRAIPTNRK